MPFLLKLELAAVLATAVMTLCDLRAVMLLIAMLVLIVLVLSALNLPA